MRHTVCGRPTSYEVSHHEPHEGVHRCQHAHPEGLMHQVKVSTVEDGLETLDRRAKAQGAQENQGAERGEHVKAGPAEGAVEVLRAELHHDKGK